MENTIKKNLNVVIEVKATDYQNGKLKNVFGGKAQITKADTDRVSQNDEDAITFRASDCGTPKMEVDYRSTSIGQGETETAVEIDVKGQTFDMNKSELIDAIASSSKLTKADAGRALDKKIEDYFTLKAEKSCEAECANIESYYTTKTSEIK